MIDTREAAGALGGPALEPGAARAFAVVGQCQIPSSALAIAVNVTVVAPTAPGHVRLFASGAAAPETSTLNYQAGRTRANNAVVALGTGGALVASVHQSSGSADLVVDVTGYFASDGCSPAQTPARPLPGVHTGDRTVSWPAVPGATSYDLYVKAVPGPLCGTVPSSVFVTRADQKVPGVSSPHDISAFNACDTCYFVDLVAVSGACESPLESDLGLVAPLGFSLMPCVP